MQRWLAALIILVFVFIAGRALAEGQECFSDITTGTQCFAYLPLLEKPLPTTEPTEPIATPGPIRSGSTATPIPATLSPLPPSAFCEQHPVTGIAPNYPLYIAKFSTLNNAFDLFSRSPEEVFINGWWFCNTVTHKGFQIDSSMGIEPNESIHTIYAPRPFWSVVIHEPAALFDRRGNLIAYIQCPSGADCTYKP